VIGNATAGTSAPVVGATAGGAADSAVNDYVANAARKRYGYIVDPVKVISWDHTKLLSS
jgi:hypothetical protein